jgi:hypothetical protein
MQSNGPLTMRLPRRRKAKDDEPRLIRGIVRAMGFRGA